MNVDVNTIPVTGKSWSFLSEAYARLIADHLTPESRWLDAGSGYRLLEGRLDPLEDWLVARCDMAVALDVTISKHLNIPRFVCGSLYGLPFKEGSFDLVTCNMVVEHLAEPTDAIAQIARVLSPGGAFIINTPNLWNYGILGNAVLTKVLPERLRLRMVRASDQREPDDIFPVRYRANTVRRLVAQLEAGGLTVHKCLQLRQQRPFFEATAPLEKLLMKLTPGVRLLVCAHKPAEGAVRSA